MAASRSPGPGPARRTLAGALALTGTLVWTHALAGVVRAAAGQSAEALAPAGLALTLAAVASALAGGAGSLSSARAALRAAAVGAVGAALVGGLHPGALLPALALVPAAAACAALGAWLARRLPAALDTQPALHPVWSALWVAAALLAVVQVGRLATHRTNPESAWFLSTRHPFYAAHDCLNAYLYGAELARRGEPNLYDARHYPGLDPQAAPRTALIGMTPEDPYQYPPPFLLLPRLAIALTHDYAAVRVAWLALNMTLCLSAVIALAFWVGGRSGAIAGLLTPVLLSSFPVLHDFQYGQLHFAVIALAVLAMLSLQRGRHALGGSLLAFSILTKLFPAVLLVPLAVQRRWRALAWTAGATATATALALAVLGTAPFVAFATYQLPRLADGSAFAFGEAWPEVAMLVTAGNQGIHGVVQKLAALGVPGADATLARLASALLAAGVLALAVLAGRREATATRVERALPWLGLLGLGSLLSAGAWADYVPLTGVWLLAFLAPLAAGRPLALAGLGSCALLQVFLLGSVPIGEAADPRWMLPLSLAGALALLVTFAAAGVVRVRERKRVRRPRATERIATADARPA